MVQGAPPGVSKELRDKYPALYGRPSAGAEMERRELEALDQEPGPGAYFGPDSQGFSSLGAQRFSSKKSEPAVKFAKTGEFEFLSFFLPIWYLVVDVAAVARHV